MWNTRKILVGLASIALLAGAGNYAVAGSKPVPPEKREAKQGDAHIENSLIESIKDLYLSYYGYLTDRVTKEEFMKNVDRTKSLDRLVGDYDFDKSFYINNPRFFNRHGLYVFEGKFSVEGNQFHTFYIGTDYKKSSETVMLGKREVKVNRVLFGKTIVPMIDNYVQPDSLLGWNNGITVFQEKEVFKRIAGKIYDSWSQYENARSAADKLMFAEFSADHDSSKSREDFIKATIPRLIRSKLMHEANHLYNPEDDSVKEEYECYRKELMNGDDQKYNLAFYIENRSDRTIHGKAGDMIIKDVMGYIHDNQQDYPGIEREEDLYKLSKEQIAAMSESFEFKVQ